MAIDININNQNKHWILVILGKVKDALLSIWNYIIKIYKSIYSFAKRKRKLLVGIVVLLILIGATMIGLSYYYDEYLPKKLLDDALSEINNNFYNEKNDSAKGEYAYYILTTDEWGYKNVYDSQIDERLLDLKKEAFHFIESQAFAGNASCQYNLGRLYSLPPKISIWGSHRIELKRFVMRDSVKAAYWWNEAAQQGYIEAYNNIGAAYAMGFGVKKDIRKAIEWIRKGAEAGDATAQYNYGCYFEEGYKEKSGSHREIRRTANFYYDNDKVVRQEYDENKGTSVTYYWDEVNDSVVVIPKDIEQAKYWWKKAAEQGDVNAKERLQQIYN